MEVPIVGESADAGKLPDCSDVREKPAAHQLFEGGDQ